MHHAYRTDTVRAATVLLLVVLVMTGPAAPALLVASASDAPLLSEGRPALGLTRKSAEFPAGNAVDGNPETRWASRPEDPQWLRVDLEQTADVRRVEIDWGAAYSTAYSIQVSDDGAVWGTRWYTDKGDGGKDVITVPGDGHGRYVRVRAVTHSGSVGTAIRELRVYGLAGSEDPVDTGIPAPAPAASPKPSSSASSATTPPATTPTASSPPPAAQATTAPTPSAQPSPAPSRSEPPTDAAGEVPPPGGGPRRSPSPSSSPPEQNVAVRGAEEAAAVGPIVPILYAVGVMAGLVALGVWLGRRQALTDAPTSPQVAAYDEPHD